MAKLAKEDIAPLVRKMEKEAKIDDTVLKVLFENGVSFIKKSKINDNLTSRVLIKFPNFFQF